jgi:hypothetical protein
LHRQSAEGPAMFQQKTQNQNYEKPGGKFHEEQKDFLSSGARPQRKHVELLAENYEWVA